MTLSARFRAALAASTAVASLAVGATAASAATSGRVAPQNKTTHAEECRDLALINQARAAKGLPALVGLQAKLTWYARQHAQDIVAKGELFHDLAGLEAAAPAGWYAIGENVGAAGSIDKIHSMYMADAPHRDNILSDSYNYVGVGVWHTASGTVIDSEDFLGDANSLAVLSC